MPGVVIALLALLAQTAAPAGGEAPTRPLLTARVLGARVSGVSAGVVDLALNVGLTASRPVTIRGIVFKESDAGGVPVAIDEVRGRWRLDGATELVLDAPIRVRLYVHDSRRLRDVAALLSRDAVPVRSLVEVTFDPPLLSRLFLMSGSRMAVAATTLDVSGSELIAGSGGLLRLAAEVAGLAGSAALPFLERLQTLLPGEPPWLEQLSTSAAILTTTYAIVDGQGVRRSRSVASVGFWWTEDTLCTTREALEPWRFDVTDATAIAGGGTLEPGSFAHEVAAPQFRVRLESASLIAGLPAIRGRKTLAVEGSDLRRIRLLDREEASNVACLRGIRGVPVRTAGVMPAERFRAAAVDPGEPRFDLVWTDAGRGESEALHLTAPIAATSFGSPLLVGGEAAGMIVSSRRALPGERVARAAAEAIAVRILP